MGAMKRMARFFYGSSALRRENLSESRSDEPKGNQVHLHDRGANRTLVITETKWREAPRKYQSLVEQGQTVCVEDDRGRVIIFLGFSSLEKDINVEKEMQELLKNGAGERVSISGSWLE
jgi:hypothetical protein